MQDRRDTARPSLSIKSIVVMAGIVGAIAIAVLTIQQSNDLQVRPASGTASALAAASDQDNQN